jgi:hypothetical protein
VKVAIALSRSSVEFFKKEAKKYNTQYQKMIRRLLDEYTAHQSGQSTGNCPLQPGDPSGVSQPTR